MCNMAISDNKLLRRACDLLGARLPAGWRVEHRRSSGESTVLVISPDRRRARLATESRRRFDPRSVTELAATSTEQRPLVISPFLTRATRAKLQELGFPYLDLTGNLRLALREPGLFVETAGSDQTPGRVDRGIRTLKGPKAGRVVRALCDFRGPVGVRELAHRAQVDAGYVSRLLSMLDREALLERGERNRVEKVNWAGLIRRWAEDAPLAARGEQRLLLDPRGLTGLFARLPNAGTRFAVSGSFATAGLAPVAPARLAIVYVGDAMAAIGRLGLREAEAGSNVLLIEPLDDVVFERAREKDRVAYVAPSQAAADLLTSPGRGPAEAEELLSWMTANEGAWRR
jgi:hypothetical protein